MKASRICMLTTFYPPFNFGGDGIFVRRLANALARRGCEVHVIHDPGAFLLLSGRSPSSEAYRDRPGVVHHPIRHRWVATIDLAISHQLGRPVGVAQALRTTLSRINPDVIHFHNISLLGGPGVLKLGSAIKICTLHDYWFVCPMHTLWRFDREACTRRTCLRCTLRGRRPPQLWRSSSLTARMAREVDLFLAPSRFSAESHRANGFPAPIRYLPHFAMPPADPVPRSRSGDGGRPFFLFAGRLEKLKGIQELIRAFRSVPHADLLIAGAGTWEPALREVARGLSHVRFLGWVDDQELQQLLGGCTAAVIPSLCYETFGLVAVEAFATGTPVILRRVGALAELAEENGGAVAYDSLDGLVEAIRSLIGSPRRWRQLAEAGRRRYLSDYTEEAHLNRYFELIEEAESTRSAKGVR